MIVPMTLMGVVVVGGIWLLTGDSRRDAPWVFPLVAALVFVTLGRTAQKTARTVWSSYEIELHPDRIVRRQANTPDLELDRASVTALQEVPGKALNVIGATRAQVVSVPALISDYESIRAELLQWHSAAPIKRPDRGLPMVAVAVFTSVGLFVMAFSRSVPPLVGALAAGALSPLFVYVLWHVPRSPHFDARTRRAVWWSVLPLLALVMRVARYISDGQ